MEFSRREDLGRLPRLSRNNGDKVDKQTAEKLISKTRDDYNLIADQFASTRRFNWGDFAVALHSLPIKKGAKVLDLGCGNGRVHELLKDLDIKYYGLDLSEELIKHAKKNIPNGHFVVGNLLHTPYKDDEFDVVLCAAVLHHIPSKTARQQAITEIYRITRPSGHILVTSWYFWNKPQFLKLIFSDWKLPFGDFMMPWKDGSGKHLTSRYFHAWTKGELATVLRKAGFVDTKVFLYFKTNKKIGNNLIATAKKPK